MTNSTSPTQIVVASADCQSRDTILAALRSEPGFHVIGKASDADELLALRRRTRPDILLLDSTLAGHVNGGVSSWPRVRIILLASVIDQWNVTQVLRLAARGIVPKNAQPHLLLKSIRCVLADEYWLGADTIAILVEMVRGLLPEDVLESSPDLGLTARERDIVLMIANGHSNREIAQELAIGERTVKHHLTSIFAKLGISPAATGNLSRKAAADTQCYP